MQPTDDLLRADLLVAMLWRFGIADHPVVDSGWVKPATQLRCSKTGDACEQDLQGGDVGLIDQDKHAAPEPVLRVRLTRSSHARYLCNRLRPRFPELQVVVALWTTSASTKSTRDWMAALNIRDFVTTLADATEQIARLASEHRLMPAGPEVV